jgi:trimeric autotransporter adhesin
VFRDRHGLATVKLPDYFEALNQEFRYQLTVMGQFAQAIVATKIAANRFVIRTSKPGVEASWQATGIRHDAYANAFRIPVEEEKPLQGQGHYLHPGLFGASPEQAIRYPAPTVPVHAQNTHISSLTALAQPQ